MKRLNEMTNGELLELTDEEKTNLIDLECAHGGVALLPPLPEKVEVSKPEKDMIIYEIPSFYLQNKDDADMIVDLVESRQMKMADYDWSGSERIFKEKSMEIKISCKKCYSKNTLDKYKSDNKEALEAKKAYDTLKDLYNDIRSDRKDIVEDIYGKINEAWKEKSRKDSLQISFDRYLSLAENNATTALKFLRDANPNEKTLIDIMFSHYENE